MSRVLTAALCLALLGAAPAFAAPFQCGASSAVLHDRLPVLREQVHEEHSAAILAIGSSSTQGVGASSPASSYPSVLQQALTSAMPGVAVEVVNAGVGGETADTTLARLRQALASRHYGLVIWQVGTNDAVAGVDLGAFERRLRAGINLVRRAKADLILVDQQFTPKLGDEARYESFVDAVRRVAKSSRAPVFQRFEMMRGWAKAGQDQLLQALADDRFHMNDVGYRCLAHGLAEQIRSALESGPVAFAPTSRSM